MALLIKIGASLKDFDRQMRRATKEIQYVANKFTNMGSTLTRGLTVPLLGIAVAAGKVGVDFETQMLRVQAISGATGDELQALEDKARELGSTTMYSATEAAEGLENYARAGFSVQESLDALEPSVNLAIATGVDLASVTDIMAGSIKGFGLEATKAADVADLLASTASSTNTDIEELGEAFSYVAPVAAAAGYSMEDVSEALGLMAQASIDSSSAGTALRTALTNLASPTATAKAKLKELGVEIADSEGNMYSLDDVVGQLRGSFADLSEQEQIQAATEIFGKRAMSGMLAVINATEDDINLLADATSDYSGTVKEQADIMQSGAKGGWMRLKSAAEELAISFSEVLLPAFNKLVAKVQTMVDWLNALSPAQKETMVKFLGIAAALGPLLLIAGKGISIFGKLHGMFTAVSKGVSIFSGLMTGAALPIIGIIAAVAALIAGFIYLFKTNEAFRTKVMEIWAQIQEMFSVAVEFIKALLTALGAMFSWIWENNFMNVQGIVQSGWQYITEIFSFAIQLITDIFKVFTALLQGDWQGALEAILTLCDNIWSGIKKVFKAGINYILNLFGTNLDAMVANVKEKLTAIKDKFEELKDKVNGIIDNIKEIWQNFKLPTFTLRTSTRTFLGITITFPTGFNINWHAEGGIFTQPTVLGGHGFGEAGKEAILPLSKLPGLLGLNSNNQNIIQIILDGKVIEECVDGV
ncbi:MAG: phage tail tape measure protein, partial [Eubacteriales bacterium]